MKKGDKIILSSSDASGSNIARVSRWNSDGTFYKVLSLATTSLSKYEYVVEDNVEYIRFSKDSISEYNLSIKTTKAGKNLESYINERLSNIDKDEIFTDISMFSDIAVCGDSYTSGTLFSDITTIQGEYASISWGKCLERISGSSVTVYASGGADTRNWQTRSQCLPQLLSDSPHQLYIICLGINDYATYGGQKGSISDVKDDYTQNADTYYGNYGKIIAQIMAHSPKAKIILIKNWLVQSKWSAYYDFTSTPVEELAEHFGIKFIETKGDSFFESVFFADSHVNHPIEATYSGMAKRVKYLIEKNIQENYLYYRDYGFTN